MFKDLEKVIAAEMPDFVAVKRSLRDAPPQADQIAESPLPAPAAAHKSAQPPSDSQPYRESHAASYEADALDFFGSGDPRARLVRKNFPRNPDAAPAGIIAVEPVSPEADSSSRHAPVRRIVVRDGKIVGEQG